MNETLIHTYRERAARFHRQERAQAQQLRLMSVLRLLLFAAGAWFLYRAIATRFVGSELLVSMSMFIAFIIGVVVASNIKRKIAFLQQLVRINENEIAVAGGEASFLDNGAALMPSSGFAGDLNVFGRFSLFHLLNRTGSTSGRRQLAARLTHPHLSATDIEHDQRCAQELAALIDFRQTLLAQTLSLKEEDTLETLQQGVPMESFAVLNRRLWSFLGIAWPLLGIASIVYSVWKGNYGSVLAVTFLGLLLIGSVLKKVNLLYNHISRRSYLYAQYARCFALIGEQDFQYSQLRAKKEEILHAAKAFQRLSRLTGLFDLRLSALTLLFNGLFLFDLFCARAYLRWNARYQSQVKNWFEVLGEIERLDSIATFHLNHPSFIFPQADTTALRIEASGMGHPLMHEQVAVVNDINIGSPEKLHLITGSNMSGKSTFLRTLGLNLVLAQIGAPVFAQRFVFSPVRLLTSFHHIDSLEESTSYFYAELKSLKAIVDTLAQGQPALVLLDEVMRGTNSQDKHDGSALLIQKLLEFDCLSLVATHDTELGILADHHRGAIANFCFESELVNNELQFDFRKRPGIAQSKNATFLMKRMGII